VCALGVVLNDTTKSPTTFIDTTANGVDLINIANPNSVGVSINHYNKFNVDTQGAILNNSKVMGTSQLGGAVYGNPNLNQNADIILNEVGTTNRSVLNGALEVFGQNAAVVIANPNGFDCNGCSFINTSKLTMVSGQSQVSDGAITGFKINNDLTSNFVIGKLGLYANNTDKVNIISRAIALRGELQAKQDLALKQGNVRSLLILKPVIAPSLTCDCPLTIVSLEVLIKLQPLQSKPLGLAIKVNIISRAIALRGELQAKQDLALKQGNDYYNYITVFVSSGLLLILDRHQQLFLTWTSR
jgi:filamentous hemagglutinin family protein